MIGLLADHDVEGAVQLIWARFSDDEWHEFQVSSLALLSDVGLALNASDREIWLLCQSEGRLLLTGNRNMRGPESLEAVIRTLGDIVSLPVLTIADPKRVETDGTYCELCAYRVADIALELSRYRGTARLFIP